MKRPSETFEDVVRRLKKEGYYTGAPSLSHAVSTDREVCARSVCPVCDHRGMVYHPFLRDTSYRVFFQCPNCGYFDEFLREDEMNEQKLKEGASVSVAGHKGVLLQAENTETYRYPYQVRLSGYGTFWLPEFAVTPWKDPVPAFVPKFRVGDRVQGFTSLFTGRIVGWVYSNAGELPCVERDDGVKGDGINHSYIVPAGEFLIVFPEEPATSAETGK